MQFQEISDGFVFLLGELEDDAAWRRRTLERIYFTGEAAQVSGGVGCRSERVWTGWWGQAGGHDWWGSVELEVIKDLTERNERREIFKQVLMEKRRDT